MNKTESYCYQKYKSSLNNSCVIKEKNIVGKNLLEGTYFDGNGIPKMIGITKAEYLEYKKLQQENKQQSEKIGKLEDNWNKLREWIVYNKHNENTEQHYLVVDYGTLLGKMQELEQGSDSNE